MRGGGGGVGRDREGRGRVVSGKGGAATKGGRWMRDRGRGAATRRGPEMNGEEGRRRRQEKGVCDGEGGRGGERERYTGRRRSSRSYRRSPMDRKTQQPPLAEENAAATRARQRKTPRLLPPFAGGDEVSRRAPRKRWVKERLSSVHDFFKQPQPDPGLLLKYYDGTQANIAYMGFRGINTNTLCAHSKCYIPWLQRELTTNLPYYHEGRHSSTSEHTIVITCSYPETQMAVKIKNQYNGEGSGVIHYLGLFKRSTGWKAA
ncbi:hypothetical protein C4D60_Mb01t02680 [Musa balbisiana]|uniref:Uncharacterized protein n=1 Tax=Musa balbisiana TaxID=52838 RepID=A0A4S8JJD1_MUSBA|nr:hypothetical protein C4D60_Mb01t02680 [Musa balbisiana]